MALHLRTRTFQIEEATIGAVLLRPYWKKYDRTITDAMTWSLSIICLEAEFDGAAWEPEFNFERFHLPVERWTDLEHLTASLEGGAAHVVGHDTVGQTEVSFGRRKGTLFQLTCIGVCDVNWDEEFGRCVPYRIETRVRFEGVRVVGTSDDDDDSLREFLRAHFRLDGLSEQPCAEADTPPRSKVRMIEKLFRPGRVKAPGRRSS